MSRTLTALLVMALAGLWAASGCKPQEEKSQPAKTPAPTPTKAGDKPLTPATPAVKGVDALDSNVPQVQGKFPRSGQVNPWIKVLPVKFYQGADMKQLPASDVALYQSYGVDWQGEAMYQYDAEKNANLVVQIAHCPDSGQAYGLMSVSSDQPADVQIGQETRGGEGAQLNIWTGSYYVRLYASPAQQGLRFIAGMQQVARDMVSNLPNDGKRPELLAALPTRDQLVAQQWCFRGPQSLYGAGAAAIPHIAAVAKALALDSDDEVAMAAYRVAGARSPCVMFVARFASDAKAAAAQSRLLQIQTDGSTTFGLSLLVNPDALGTYVFGTLTGDEYGMLEKNATAENAAELPVFPTLARKLGGR